MTSPRDKFDVLIAGAGPAGTSASIYLAQQGVRVALVEQKKFPRAKLCGEFISPECWEHFDRLAVGELMSTSQGASLTRTVFYTRRQHSVTVPSSWLGQGRALGLSRAEMDDNLLQRAREVGVTVIEDTTAQQLIVDKDTVRGAWLKSGDASSQCIAELTIDATGRARSLARRLDQTRKRSRAPLVAFKAHVSNARPDSGACEIYVYPGGYGGLNEIEGDVANLCFIVSARDAQRRGSDPVRLMREVVFQNARAAFALKHARVESAWLAVALERFGHQSLVPAKGLLTAGDAAAFIDPFTGSGMLMALESGELAAKSITRYLKNPNRNFEEFAVAYKSAYAKKFDARLRVCGMLRRVAFVPLFAEAAIYLFSSDRLRHRLSRAMRKGAAAEHGAIEA